jgi:hypothetical protein
VDLYSVPVDGASVLSPQVEPIKLNGSLFGGVDLALPSGISPFSVDRRGEKVAFVMRSGEGSKRLFVVPVDRAEEPVALSPESSFLGAFRFTPDASHVVFAVRVGPADALELRSARVDGAVPAVTFNGRLMHDRFAISPDSRWVVHFSDLGPAGVSGLYASPVDGGSPPMRLNGDLTAGGAVYSFDDQFGSTGDSLRVVYMAEQDTDGVAELYSSPLP